MPELFPDKFTPVEQTIVGEAALLITVLESGSQSVGQAYLAYKAAVSTGTFESFAMALAFLYAAGAVEQDNQMLRIA